MASTKTEDLKRTALDLGSIPNASTSDEFCQKILESFTSSLLNKVPPKIATYNGDIIGFYSTSYSFGKIIFQGCNLGLPKEWYETEDEYKFRRFIRKVGNFLIEVVDEDY